ncbi:MAG: beta-ketoacyl-ACP synthase I [Rhizobiales bacterium]|nr:beta-ketoacyl-ACP synthase I [Hyphomicrobiales bacterium]NRB15280.1 beta-ketoacyl-ACP synthase I [Hyphomicrobiales bacterium]
MRRVVVTGMGVVSSIGDNVEQVKQALWDGTSGIAADQDMIDHGFRSQVSGAPKLDWETVLDRKERRFMGAGAAWNYIAMKEALAMSGLEDHDISNIRTGLIMGSGGPSTKTLHDAMNIVREKGSTKRIGPLAVPKAMSSTNSATLATPFKIKGMSYSISSACTTSLHCIGNAVEMIQWGKQDVMFAGGGEELFWGMSCLFDAMGAMSSKFNDAPTTASRTYDIARDGFIIAGGAGVLVLEEYERAKARGANIIAEVTGYGATSDGYDMVAPSGEGGQRAMELALSTHKGKVDYINPHGTSTPVGDIPEIDGIRNVWGADKAPIISATKALTGHSLGAAGVQESIYSLIMMRDGFICESANITEIDPRVADMPIARKRTEQEVVTVLSNSFGFGGTNGSVIFSRENL